MSDNITTELLKLSVSEKNESQIMEPFPWSYIFVKTMVS